MVTVILLAGILLVATIDDVTLIVIMLYSVYIISPICFNLVSVLFFLICNRKTEEKRKVIE